MKECPRKHRKKSNVTKKRVIKKKFRDHFTEDNLRNIFDERILSKDSAGIDGIHAHDLKEEESFEIIDRKVSAGTYRFTSYAEIQVPKGRGKLPRILAFPTVRDRIVLSGLKDYLHEVFPENVNRILPNAYIFELNKEIQKIKRNNQSFGYIHADVSGFYDNIDREKLMNFVRRKVVAREALKLIYRAIVNPITPRSSKKSERFHYYTPKGVPQGLAISNILAGIYMSKFDQVIQPLSSYCVRYVDDILILCPTADISRVRERLNFEISKLGLTLNKEKTKTGVIGKDSFVFLGYNLKADGHISIKDASVRRKISSLAGKISSADHRKDGFLKLHNIDRKTYRDVLIEDINEQITGAISESKRYGWLFYFSQINNMTLLHRLDRIVEKLCKRCHTFAKRKPKAIKSFVVAFREIHKLNKMQTDMDSSYIPSYDNWNNRQKIEFLNNRGQLIKDKPYTRIEIDRLFKINIRKRLLELEKDLQNMS